jgi:hypothetical protein
MAKVNYEEKLKEMLKEMLKEAQEYKSNSIKQTGREREDLQRKEFNKLKEVETLLIQEAKGYELEASKYIKNDKQRDRLIKAAKELRQRAARVKQARGVWDIDYSKLIQNNARDEISNTNRSYKSNKDIKMELAFERSAQDNKDREEKKKKEEDPSENFEKELQKQAIQQKQRAINKSFKEYGSSSDDEEDTNPMSVLRRRQKSDRKTDLRNPELKKIEEELLSEYGASLLNAEDKDEKSKIKKNKYRGQYNPYRLSHSATPQKDNNCSHNNCTIMGGSNDDSPSFTGYFEKYKEIVDSIVNMYNNKKFIEDLKELENYRENVLTDLENPEEIREINANITMIKSLLKIINKNLSNFEELNRVILDKNQKDKLQTKLSGKINFFIAKLEEKELELSDAAINNIRLLNTEEPQSYSAYSDLISQNASDPYAMEDRKVIRKRTTNDGIGGKTKKRKIKKRNKSKKNKRRVSKK